ncbi:cupin domain-containing protein [Oxalobacteraceae bacterium OM1]|nr:cupin domain-containing protein [Oxalobacteraceae bacterium OM1]
MHTFHHGRLLPGTLLLALSAATALAAAPAADKSAQGTFVEPGSIQWQDGPPGLPKGAKFAVLSGDPSKDGPFVIRLRAPPGYRIPPHWHTQDEILTILSGAMHFGSGDKENSSSEHVLKTGAFHSLPGKSPHYAYTKEATTIQVHGNGPFDIHYVNEADAPQSAKK